jgi:hypothetical protein
MWHTGTQYDAIHGHEADEMQILYAYIPFSLPDFPCKMTIVA